MAVHDDEVAMVREALPEYLELARIGIRHQKANGGALGFPSAACLFALVDAIGSFHRGDQGYTVQVDGAPMTIDRTSDHILILNSPYFGLDLTLEQLREVYRLSRSPLTHNAMVGGGQWLWVGEPERPAIDPRPEGIHVYLPALLARCEQATQRFLAVADTVVPGSLAVKELRAKRSPSYDDQVKALAEEWAKSPGEWTSTQVTGQGRPPDRFGSRR